jgi:hypothetical protein
MRNLEPLGGGIGEGGSPGDGKFSTHNAGRDGFGAAISVLLVARGRVPWDMIGCQQANA